MYLVYVRLIIVQACKRQPRHPRVFSIGRPNWWRICHPFFLRCWPSSKLGLL